MVHRSESELVLDKIVFADRNKAYGAFEIRSNYNSNLKFAIIIASLVFTSALLTPVLVKLLGKEEVVEETYKVTEVVLAEPPPIDPNTPPPPPPPEVEAPKIKTTQFLPPVIKEDHEVIEEVKPPKVEELKVSTPSSKTQEGTTDNLNAIIIPDGNGNAEIGEAKVEEPVTWVPEQPGFRDGELVKFLAKNINYPVSAVNKGTEGKVFVEFVIEKDGSISSVKVVKGIGEGCDEEAMRVIRLTNGKWSPGKNNGNPVRLRKVQPITFKLNKD